MFYVYIDPLYVYQNMTNNILIFTNVCKWLLKNSEYMRNIAQTFQALVTSFGIIIAGFWFIEKRQQFPRANLKHKIIHKELDENTVLIHITVTIKNIGNVLIEINHADIRIHWVAPLTKQIDELIIKAKNKKDLEIQFPEIDSRELNLNKKEIIIIEPSETHNIDCDFILRKENLENLPKKEKIVTTIMIYCYIRNITSRHRPLGWSFEEFYNLD